jgi:site-specific DNA recombinase
MVSEHSNGNGAPVVAYMRVSTDEQRERATIETQRVEIDRHAAEHSITLAAWYADDGWSGRRLTLGKRPDGARLLADAGTGAARTVLVYRVDRLGRGRKLLATIDELETAGVRYIISVTEARYDLKDPNDEFHLTMLSGVSGYEASSFLRRSKDATNRLAREGAWLGGIVPYGYRVEGEGRTARLVISEEPLLSCTLTEADVIRLIYRRTVKDDWPCQRIADELNTLRVPPAYVRDGRTALRGKRAEHTQGIWRASRVRNMIVSSTYMGVHRYGKRSPDEEREVIERAVPAIVDVETWGRAQKALRAHLVFSPRNAKHKYLLRGLVKCGLCGLTYCGTIWHAGGGERIYYRCNGASQARGLYGSTSRKCPSKAVDGRWLEAQVWADVEAFLRDPGDVLAQLAEQLRGRADRTEELRDVLAGLKLRLGDKQGERDVMLGLYRRGRIDDGALNRQLDQIVDEERELLAAIAEYEASLTEARRTEEDLRTADTLLRDLRERLDASPDFETRRRIIATLVEGVTVDTQVDERGQKHAAVAVRYRFDAPDVRASLPAFTDRRGTGSSPPRA